MDESVGVRKIAGDYIRGFADQPGSTAGSCKRLQQPFNKTALGGQVSCSEYPSARQGRVPKLHTAELLTQGWTTAGFDVQPSATIATERRIN